MHNAHVITYALREINSEMKSILSGQADTYCAASNIWAIAMALFPESPDLMHPLWLIWGALTDWPEIRPEESPQAELKMKQAAAEWLALDQSDPTQVHNYLQRWVYEEMGYSRNAST